MSEIPEILQLTDDAGRAVQADLWLSAVSVWHVELQVKEAGEWLYLDLVPIDELESYLDEDGSLSLTHAEPAPDEPDGVCYGTVMTLPGDETARLERWVKERLRFRPPRRSRRSPLAERASRLVAA